MTRRQCNRTFFDRLSVDEDGVQRADLSDLYTDILAEDLVRDLEVIEANPERVARGSTFNRVVDIMRAAPEAVEVRTPNFAISCRRGREGARLKTR